ncbi:Predicted PurR-regulated permease PerM [Amycolatopsis saalfeldensis]|uniref:Predicted PurR-regulated permease PerM n=1 Tax=Amycolatopsis saalfeldensis TaxID=394193 RepID=A0A1H8YJX6_9PSEU|nr:Predicted PurR-regulated permease PerM [Amycolatopsis saalfeldensis]
MPTPEEIPAEDGTFAAAEAAAAELRTPEQPMGTKGKPLDRRSPFLIGLTAAAGVAVTYGLVRVVAGLQDVLILIGLALFLAIGLEPAVAWLVRHRLPRWLAVTTVFVVGMLAVGGFLTAAIPVLVEQATQFAAKAPGYLHDAQDHGTVLGKLNERFHLQQQLEGLVSGSAGGLLGAGQAVFSAITNVLILVVLTVYFVAGLPRIRAGGYRLIPHSRRPRAILIGDQIFTKVGGYVLGNLAISVIAGVLTLVWLLVFGVPYAALLAITVAILDLIPVIGSVIGGVLACLVALTVSLPACPPAWRRSCSSSSTGWSRTTCWSRRSSATRSRSRRWSPWSPWCSAGPCSASSAPSSPSRSPPPCSFSSARCSTHVSTEPETGNSRAAAGTRVSDGRRRVRGTR